MLGRCQSTRTAKMFLSTAPKQGWLPDCLPASVCVTRAPMWRAQAASLAVSHNSSKSGTRYGRSVSSSSPVIGLDWNRVEVTCCVIGWDWSQWKIYPFLFLSFLQCSGMWLCVYACVHTVHVHLCVCKTCLHYMQWWACVCVCVLTDLTFLYSMMYKHRLPHPAWYNNEKLRSAFTPVFMGGESQ